MDLNLRLTLRRFFRERNREDGEDRRIQVEEERFCLEGTMDENGVAVASIDDCWLLANSKGRRRHSSLVKSQQQQTILLTTSFTNGP